MVDDSIADTDYGADQSDRGKEVWEKEVSITAWTVIVVIAVAALVVITKLAIFVFMMKREEIRSIHQQPNGSHDEEVDDIAKSRRERRE